MCNYYLHFITAKQLTIFCTIICNRKKVIFPTIYFYVFGQRELQRFYLNKESKTDMCIGARIGIELLALLTFVMNISTLSFIDRDKDQ